MKTAKGGAKRKTRSESDDGKRSVHNHLERQRRVDLRNLFEKMRKLIPELAQHEKSPKVQILKKGTAYCLGLSVEENNLVLEKLKLEKQNRLLRERIAEMS